MAEMRRKSDQDFREGCGPTGPGDRQADRVGGRDLGINAPTATEAGVFVGAITFTIAS